MMNPMATSLLSLSLLKLIFSTTINQPSAMCFLDPTLSRSVFFRQASINSNFSYIGQPTLNTIFHCFIILTLELTKNPKVIFARASVWHNSLRQEGQWCNVILKHKVSCFLLPHKNTLYIIIPHWAHSSLINDQCLMHFYWLFKCNLR